VRHSARPSAVERGEALTEGGRGEVERAKLFTILWALPELALVLQPGLIALSGPLATGVSWFVNGDGFLKFLFYPNVEKLYALIGPINDFGDWEIGNRWFFKLAFWFIMHHSWRVKSQRRVRPAVVIQMDALNGCLASLPFTFEIRIQPIFLF